LSAEGYSDIYGSLIYKRKIIIQPAQMVNYYLVLMLTSVGQNDAPIEYIDIDLVLQPPHVDMWWKPTPGKATAVYIRTLESILSRLVYFENAASRTLPNGEVIFPAQ